MWIKIDATRKAAATKKAAAKAAASKIAAASKNNASIARSEKAVQLVREKRLLAEVAYKASAFDPARADHELKMATLNNEKEVEVLKLKMRCDELAYQSKQTELKLKSVCTKTTEQQNRKTSDNKLRNDKARMSAKSEEAGKTEYKKKSAVAAAKAHDQESRRLRIAESNIGTGHSGYSGNGGASMDIGQQGFGHGPLGQYGGCHNEDRELLRAMDTSSRKSVSSSSSSSKRRRNRRGCSDDSDKFISCYELLVSSYF